MFLAWSSAELTGGVILKSSCNLLSSSSSSFSDAQVPSTLQFLQDKLITHNVRSDVLMAAALSSAALHCCGYSGTQVPMFCCCLYLLSTRVFCIHQGPAKLFPSTHLSEVNNVAQIILHISQSLYL